MSEEILNYLENDKNYNRDCNDGSYYLELPYGVAYEIKDLITNLQQENKQLKELKYKFFDNSGDEESFTLEDYLEISNKLYDYEQENKQLKSILTELEEWLKEETKLCDDYLIGECHTDYTDVLDKIQKLKEKYK